MSLCKQCGMNQATGDLCMDCFQQNMTDLAEITRLADEGHTVHCASRQVWGDGECSCELEKRYDPYWWTKIQYRVPFTTA